MKIVREHDKIYLNENRKNTPKEYFKFILKKSQSHIDRISMPTIVDVGCATGDFLYYLRSKYPSIKLTGYDVMPELLARAKEEVLDCDFVECSIYNKDSIPKKKFDVGYMFGVVSIFDDFETVFENFIELIKPSGVGYVFGIFNSENVDVLLKARRSDEGEPYQTSCNLFSKYTISKFLEKKNIEHTFTDWKISIDIPKHETDPLRTWTIRDENGVRLNVNGMQLLHTYSLLEIKL